MGWIRLAVLAMALLSGLESCASGPCRPLATPRPPLLPEDDVADGVCRVVGDGVPQCAGDTTSWRRWRYPRCSPDDPDCGPQLVRGQETCFRRQAPRRPVYHRERAARELHHCTYDGECSYNGALCMRYGVEFHGPADLFQDSPAPPDPWADPWGGRFPNPTWCGCVQGSCDFFAQ
jgi:hypothetical protein